MLPAGLIDDFPAAVDYLYSSLPVFHRQGPAAYKADIGNINQLMEYAGNPHLNGVKFIHVAGTNGKGSVSHLIAAYIQSAGYKCGLYTSPHYVDMRERIKVNGELIPKEEFVSILNFFLPVIDQIQPSYFEIICAMSFVWFSKAAVDFAVIEVGMGGRLDSTNIINPALSVITNISFDHTQFLGDTLELIATEKGGIIKENRPVVIGEYQIETMPIFKQLALTKHAPLIDAAEIIRIHESTSGEYTIQIKDVLPATSFVSALNTSYQLKNIRTFSAAVFALDLFNIMPFNKDQFANALKNVQLLTYMIGRWQIINNTPTVILDSAHNIAGVKEVLAQIQKINFRQLWIVFGTVSDKDISPILKILPQTASYIWTNAAIQRAMPANELASKAQHLGLNGETITGAFAAYQYALAMAAQDDLVVICGSIFVVADVIDGIQNNPI